MDQYLTVNGGTPSYTYLWSNGSSTQDLNNISSGTYAVTITDNIGCTASLTGIVISQPTAVTDTNSSSNVSCNGGNNGNIPVSVSGGTSPYNFIWSNASTTEDLANIGAGN